MIKHISFDVWNTLITANPEYAAARNEIIADYAFIPKVRAAATYAEVKKTLDADAERGICGNTTDAWTMLGNMLGMSLIPVSAMRRDCIEAFKLFPPNFNTRLATQIKDLSEIYSLSIKSNTNFIPGSVLARSSGLDKLPFDFMHFSDTFSMCKPEPRFFNLSFEELGMCEVGANEILHIGDNLICDGKCVDVGMQFCHIKNPEDLLNKLINGDLS